MEDNRNYVAPGYVSKKTFLIILVIAILFAAFIGASVASVVSKSSGAPKSYKNLTSGGLDKVTGSKLTISEIVDANKASVVEITTEKKTGTIFGNRNSAGAGSGVVVKKDGYIVTNNHVVEGSDTVSVRLYDGTTYSAEVVGTDARNDIAVIKIRGRGFKAVTIGKSSSLKTGDLAVAIGNPLGQLGGTATQGIISALDRKLDVGGMTLSLLQTDAAINSGNSGGGLFNGRGELIGIVDSKASGIGVEGLGFALPIDKVAPIIDDLIQHGRVTNRPAVGITIYDVAKEDAKQAGVSEGGTYIKEVIGGNAKKAGLKSGDRILQLDGKDINTTNEFITRVQSHKIGDTVSVKVKRDGKEITMSVILEDSNKIKN